MTRPVFLTVTCALCRRRIAEIVRDNTLGGEGGSAHIMAFINDEQHAVPSLPALRAVRSQHYPPRDFMISSSLP